MAKHLIITGKVQGVGYRHSLREEALRLGLSGWVRNRHDGSVESMVAGEPQAVDALLAWAQRGPPAARVEAMTATTACGTDTLATFNGFEQRPTA